MRVLALSLILVIALPCASSSAVPSSITVQGRLTDSTGTPFPPGTKGFLFRIFDAPSGGTEIWSGEDQFLPTDSEGLWAAQVGAIVGLTADVFTDSVRWLEIVVNGTILPRIRLVTGAYAHRVSTVDGASGGTITSKVSIGPGHINTGNHAFVAGEANVAAGNGSTVAGGRGNRAHGEYAFVGGGGGSSPSDSNSALGANSTILGGKSNSANGEYSLIAGGAFNSAAGYASIVGGGINNHALGNSAIVVGGNQNVVHAEVSSQGAIVGGRFNDILDGDAPFIGAGASNQLSGSYSAIVAGVGNLTSASHAFVGGGFANKARGQFATIAGGGTSYGNFNDSNSAIGISSFIGGGGSHVASGDFSIIPGGYNNETSGKYAFAAGRGARSIHAGSFVWADSTNSTFATTAAQQFLIRAGGGVGIGTNDPEGALHVHKGSAGSVAPDANVIAVFENSTDGYLSVFAPDANASGIFFGGPENAFNGGIVYNTVSTPDGLQFRTDGNLTQMVIDSFGNVGIGTTAPEGPLHVSRGSAGVVTANSNSVAVFESINSGAWLSMIGPDTQERGLLFTEPSNAVAGAIVFDQGGGGDDIGFRTGGNTTRMTLDASGNLTVSGCVDGNNTACASDVRFKKNVDDVDDPLALLEKLRGVTYEWKREEFPDQSFEEGRQYGVIAQEVEAVLPELVRTREDGYKSVEYNGLVSILLEAIKAQQRVIDQQNNRITRLEQRLEQ